MKKGDSVVVRSGVKDPDLDFDIGGWQGRLSAIDGAEIFVDWDSLTLEQMASEIIAHCEKEGWDWRRMNLEANEVEKATPRDTEEDVARSVARLEKKHAFDHLGKKADIVRAVLGNIEVEEDPDELAVWGDHLEAKMIFPFDARVAEYQERGPLKEGDEVIVQGIKGLNERYGVIVKLKHGREQYHFPLCDLEAIEESTDNHQLVKGYALWFANR